ncbi:UNVERIFIED_CONTAM: hypothetical protein Slati_3646600 [Sesamum latifolium]|uniref:DUF4283 domain-containing protein n=1 Tax=Sesamum latifolium TaxID=2727402 RepID=A0AAW2U198_9LAMI
MFSLSESSSVPCLFSSVATSLSGEVCAVDPTRSTALLTLGFFMGVSSRADGQGRAWLGRQQEGAGVVIPEGVWSVDSDHHLFLVGRLLSQKQPKFEALVSSINSMLNPVRGLEMRNLSEGRFLIRFHHILDRDRALEGCPWSFEKNTLILSSIGVNENPLDVDLNWCEFFVHIHNLPLSKMNLGVATLIGNKLGKFCDMDMEESGRAWGASLSIRVAINVTNPLIRALRVRSGEETPYGPWLRTPASSWGPVRKRQSDPTLHNQRSTTSNPLRGQAVFGEFGDRQEPMPHEAGNRKGNFQDLQGTGDPQQGCVRVGEAQATDRTPLEQFQPHREINSHSSLTASVESVVPDTQPENHPQHMLLDILDADQERGATQELSLAHHATAVENGDCVRSLFVFQQALGYL